MNMFNEDKNIAIYVAGHRGMVGSAIVRELALRGCGNIITRTHQELDLTNQEQVNRFFSENKIDQVYLAAAKVGGIHANATFPAEFIYENLMIEANVIQAAWQSGIKKLLLLGSSCIYPRDAEQPMAEAALLTGLLEPTNEPYAIAKIAGIKLCESYNRQYGTDFRSVMPTNLYGPGDNYHPDNSHVIPGLIRRFHDAKLNGDESVVIWGSGTPRREFLYVDDMARASVVIMNLDSNVYGRHTSPRLSHINIGTGTDITIRELAELIGKVIGFKGNLLFDREKPDGAPRKLMDVARQKSLGVEAVTDFHEGLQKSYRSYLDNLGRNCDSSLQNGRMS